MPRRPLPNGRGKIAVVSATPTSTNQNAWLAQMKQALARYPGLTLVETVYGDDVSDKSYRETVALIKRYPDLGAIVSLSSVGIVAAAKAVEDQAQAGKIKVTGLGLPSELAGYVRSGVVKNSPSGILSTWVTRRRKSRRRWRAPRMAPPAEIDRRRAHGSHDFRRRWRRRDGEAFHLRQG